MFTHAANAGINPSAALGSSRRLLERAAGVPLFFKLLVGNGLIVTVGAMFGTWLTARLAADGSAEPWLVVLFASLGLALSVAINSVVLRAALQPVEALRDAADRVRNGDLRVRAGAVRFPDPALDRLRATFNHMLDELEVQRDQLRSLSSRTLSAQEEERKRIARDLHDGVAQQLTALMLKLRAPQGANALAIADLRADLGAMLEEVRRLARELRPSVLDDLGLADAIASHIDDLRASHGVDISLSVECARPRLPRQTELALYRIAQEALTNALKHSATRKINVELRCTQEEAHLSVSDDGRGFDTERARTRDQRGLGLFGMEERAALAGGRLTIQSQPGAGTVVAASVPIEGRA